MKAGQYAFVDRKIKKRTNRQLWNIRINAAVREYGLSYSRLIDALKKKNVALDRKILAELAKDQAVIFAKVVEAVK